MTIDGRQSLAVAVRNGGGVGSEGMDNGMSKLKIYHSSVIFTSNLLEVYFSNNSEIKHRNTKERGCVCAHALRLLLLRQCFF